MGRGRGVRAGEGGDGGGVVGDEGGLGGVEGFFGEAFEEGVDEEDVVELLEGLAQRRAVHPQSLRQLALGRQLRPGWILAVEDQRSQLLGDLLGDALLLHRFEHPLTRG